MVVYPRSTPLPDRVAGGLVQWYLSRDLSVIVPRYRQPDKCYNDFSRGAMTCYIGNEDTV